MCPPEVPAAFTAPKKVASTAKGSKPAAGNIRVCLDFIKGRCTRPRCRFHHPEMAGYQQLSGVVEAQAGRKICEVWAMAGQCKFGVNCDKLHPVLIAQPMRPVLALPVPVVVPMAAKSAKRPRRKQKAGTAVVPEHPLPLAEPQSPIGSPSTSSAASVAGPSSPGSRSATPPCDCTSNASAQFEEEETEFQDLAQYILKALETEWEPTPDLAPANNAAADQFDAKMPSRASLFSMDRVFADILTDLNLAPC
eukprot:EG_transcript_20295